MKVQLLKPSSELTESKYLELSPRNLYFKKHNSLFMIRTSIKVWNHRTTLYAIVHHPAHRTCGLMSSCGWLETLQDLTLLSLIGHVMLPCLTGELGNFSHLRGLSLIRTGVVFQSVQVTFIIYFHINCTEQWYEVITSKFQESYPVSFIVK